MTATPSPINLEALLDHARIHDGLGRGDSLELIQECRRLRALSASPAIVNHWDFCSKAFDKSLDCTCIPPPPPPHPLTRPWGDILKLARTAANAFQEWNQSEDLVLDGDTLNALHDLYDAFHNPPDGVPLVDVISQGARECWVTFAHSGKAFAVSDTKPEKSGFEFYHMREVIPAPHGPTDIEKAARDYAEAFREWHEDNQLFPSDEMLSASTDLLRALGLELVENEDETKWELRPLPSNGTNPKGDKP